MRIDHDGPLGPSPTVSPTDATLQGSAAAAAAAAARQSAQGIADPAHRAEAGWRLADKPLPAGAGFAARAMADAGANARTALERTDLPPAKAAEVRAVVGRLGNALVDGRIDAHINDVFRQHLHALATEPAESAAFRGAAAQLTRAAEVLDQVELARGTRLAYDPGAGQAGVQKAGLPLLDVPDIDADLYFKTADGTLHIEGVKATPQALSNELQKAGAGGSQPTQLERQAQWQQGAPAGTRSLGLYVLDDGPGFNHLLDDRRLAQLTPLADGDTQSRRFVVGDRVYSIDDFKAISNDATRAANTHVEALKAQHVASGQPAETFSTRAAYTGFYKETLGNASTAIERYGQAHGAPRPALQALARPEPMGLKQGGLFGAAAAGGLSLLHVAADGRVSRDEAAEVARQTAVGGAAGMATVAGERVVTPVIDKAVGASVQRVATQAAGRLAPAAAAESTAAFGAGARTLVSRVGGSTVVGAAIATGVSAYENRAGLAKGDAKAIGNVTADATVAAGSIAAATAAGAAVGSVVPVAGTAVGAVVGLAVGVGVAYGAQISGARDAVAHGVSKLVDGIKGWF